MNEKLKALNVQYITWEGYYDENDDIHKHTKETLELYNEGYAKADIFHEDDVYNGVGFDNDGSILAEWWLDGDTVYFEIGKKGEN